MAESVELCESLGLSLGVGDDAGLGAGGGFFKKNVLDVPEREFDGDALAQAGLIAE